MPSRVERVSDRVVLYRCDKTAVWLARAVQHHKHFAPELAIASVLQDASPQLHLLRDARFATSRPRGLKARRHSTSSFLSQPDARSSTSSGALAATPIAASL